ncbi:MAG: CcmD family protein [Acidobacteriota bacterium]
MNQDGTLWLAAVNLIIWSGLFLYLLRLEKKLDRREEEMRKDA